jgi:hypothetical protein
MTERVGRSRAVCWPRRARGVVVALAAVLLLAGCVAIPSSGGVNQGPLVQSGGNGSSIVDLPLGPQKNASKTEIFADFLQAATSSLNNYGIAREFLTDKADQGWDPTESVLIREKPASPQDSGDNSVSYTVSTKASVNALGVYSEQATDSNETLNYSFSKVKGQWRISSLPDGIVLSRDSFENSFGDYPIYFFDPEYRYLVPDVRWFPTGSTVPNRIVLALIAGPAAWLQGGVVSTAFPAGVKAGSPVVVHNNTAVVDLSADVASAKALVRARIANQLGTSLDGQAGITQISITAHGAPVTVSNRGLSTQRAVAALSLPPLLQKGKQFGFWPRLEPLQISTRIVDLAGTAVALDRAQTTAAVLTKAGVWRVTTTAAKLVDARSGLIAPSIDPSGYVWSVPSADPSAIVAVGSDGIQHAVSSTIPSQSTIVSMDVSHDGTRLLIYLSTGTGPRLIVAGIVRRAGVPTSLGQLLDLPVSSAHPIDATWVDQSTVAALASADGEDSVTSYVIGGSPSDATTTEGAVHLVGALDLDSLRLITDSGQVQQLHASGWQDIGVTASVLATQQ